MWKTVTSFLEDNGVLCADRASLKNREITEEIYSSPPEVRSSGREEGERSALLEISTRAQLGPMRWSSGEEIGVRKWRRAKGFAR